MENSKSYLELHRDPTNLFLHYVSAPLFAFSVLTLLAGLATQSSSLSIISGVVILLTIAMQAYGHSRETHRPESTSSILYFLGEFFMENTVLFWKFVFSADIPHSNKGKKV